MVAIVVQETPGDLLRAAMARTGFNQKELAGAIGVSPSAISEWIAGRRMPEARYAPRIAELASVPERYVLEVLGALTPGGEAPREPLPESFLGTLRELGDKDREIVWTLARQLLERHREKRSGAQPPEGDPE